MKKATLKQIAELAGVSLTTVHRALNGKGGCSKEVEEKILRIAREQGYTLNIAAASLRKQPVQIAMIFPFRDKGGRFGLDRILDGYIEYRRAVVQYNIVYQEFLLRSSDVKEEFFMDRSYPELEHILTQILQEQPVRYDGVIIYGMSVNGRAVELLGRIRASGTKVIVIERQLEELANACTVRSDNAIAANLAAEMLSKGIRNPGTVMLFSKLLPGGDPCADICAQAIAAQRPELKVVQLPIVMNSDVSDIIAREMEKYPDLRGMFATSGRHTNSMLTAMAKLGIKPESTVGCELFDESYQALHDGTLDVIIDRRPEKLGYLSLRMMLSALANITALPELYEVPPRIVLRANSDAYFHRRKYHFDMSAEEE